MKSRILLGEIPSKKFHSVIFTTYSINLYYLEQQVLPLLGGKGVHYISVLVDSNMLNAQLDGYSILSEQRKRNYAIHGVRSAGAFHPKLIFLAGETSLLLLLGSGNLTTSGHGKNLEVWNTIYVDNDQDKKLGFILQAWDYIKTLHSDLGPSAQYKIKSIEENCALLGNSGQIELPDWHEIDDNLKIRFLANGGNSLFSQLSNLIGEQTIESITLMSPFYDSTGGLLHLLNERFTPREMNIILQDDFGAPPVKMQPADNMSFFSWNKIRHKDLRHDYFHAKNFVFVGISQNYLLSGSANASLAAFGSKNFMPVNHEACILYQSTDIDYLEMLEVKLNEGTCKLSDFETRQAERVQTDEVQCSVFVKAAEKDYDNISLYISSTKESSDVLLRFFGAKGDILLEKFIQLPKGEISFQIPTPQASPLFYCELFGNGMSISNKQFVIDVNAFESTNPSPRNRDLNQIRKQIENGEFSSTKIIDYLNTIYRQRVANKIAVAGLRADEEKKDGFPIEEKSDLIYLSYEEIQERIKRFDETTSANTHIEYKSNRLWDSIFSYLKESNEREEQSKIDEEETEDINKSSGRAAESEKSLPRSISGDNLNKRREKVEKFMLSYSRILRSKIDSNAEGPTLVDLSMFLIILEILLHLLGHKEKVEGQAQEEHLLPIHFSKICHSWSRLTIQFVGMFLLWCSQKQGFKKIESPEYNFKLSHYKQMAYKTTVSVLSLLTVVNRDLGIDKIAIWRQLGLLNATRCFNDSGATYGIDDFLLFVPQNVREKFGDAKLKEEINESLAIADDLKPAEKFYLHPDDGMAFIEKETPYCADRSKKYLKLFNIGYEWDDKNGDYWNGELFSPMERKWFKSRR